MAILLFICLLGLASADVIVKTKSGLVRAVASMVQDVDAFLGIPYAESPVGDLRFAKPLPKKQWKGVYNAFKMPPPCAQYSLEPYYFMPNVTNMSEDCLYLNVWVPKSNHSRGLRPIIVFIHGGGFSTGSANLYDGSKLAKRGNLMIVFINYRLGAFGYFLAYTKKANGNMGMHDQIMAIKWIKENAENFGGDPENIVLMGESAGAFSVSAHMVSPLSKHLFKRAIMESGSMVIPFFPDNAKLFRNSQMVASIAGCTGVATNLKNDPDSIVDCLKRKTTNDIIKAEKTIQRANSMTFFPRVNDEFLPKSGLDLLLEGKFRKDVDMLLGVNRDEGTLFISVDFPEYFGYYGKNGVHNINKQLAKLMARNAITLLGQRNAEEIVDYYIKQVKGHSPLTYMKMIAAIIGDFRIACGTIFIADLLSLKGNNVYFYNFEFRAASTPMAEWIGITHFDELQYVFGNPFHNNFTTKEVELSNRLMNRWSAFATNGSPNIPGEIPWFRYSYHKPLYLNIGQKEETIRIKPIDRCDIWRKRFGVNIGAPLIRFLRNSGMNSSTNSKSCRCIVT